MLSCLVGCDAGESIEQRVARCAQLPGASASGDPQLRRLLEEVREDGGTPAQLAPPSIGVLKDPSTNAAAALADCWSDSLRWRLAPIVDELMSARHEAIDPSESVAAESATTAIAAFLDDNAMLRSKLIAAAERPRCVFDPGVRLGYFAGLRYIDDAGLAARIAILEAASAATVGDGVTAWESTARALQWAAHVGRVRRVEARVLAATLRSEALATAERLFRVGVFDRSIAETLYARLRDILANWPADRRMLEGDRAVVMHSYEAIRIGLLDRVLTGHERATLEKQGRLVDLREASSSALDRDEANYLQAMRLLIGSSDDPRSETPFFERLAEFDAASAAANEPPALFARRLFLADVVESLRLTARDRGRCEAWCLGLASAAQLTMPPFRVNPVTGLDYEVVRAGDGLLVRIGDAAVDDVRLPIW